jgi:hypothetical protein
VATTGLFLIIGIDKLGRRWSLVGGAIWMMTMMFIIGGVLHVHPPTDINVISPASIAMIVMIYLYVIGYSASWGPIPWVYLSEIFPTRLRSYGVGLGASTQWLFSFCVTEFTPSAVSNLGWKTFIMFGCFCCANSAFAFFFIRETKGKSLEDMDILFGTIAEEQRRADVEQVLSKGVFADELAMDAREIEENTGPNSTGQENTARGKDEEVRIG